MNWEARTLELLAASLLRPFVLVTAAALVLRLFRVEHPASKHAVWTAVLLGMLILPVVSVMTPHLEFEALPEGTLSRLGDVTNDKFLKHSSATSGERGSSALFEAASSAPIGEENSVAAVSPHASQISTSTVLFWAYLSGVFAFAAYRLVGWVLVRRLITRSRPVLGILRESDDVSVPIAVGMVHPVVILPATWRRWNAASRRAVLSHEFAHVRRRDVWTFALSRLVKCFLWFHPLSWWVSRRISELAEMACDATAVQRVGGAVEYSKILLDFATLVHQRGYRASLPGLAMLGRSSLSRRIEQVFAISEGRRKKLTRPGLVLGLVGLPALCAASSIGLTESAAEPLRRVQESVSAKIESVAQIAKTEGVAAAIGVVLPPRTAPAEPVQSAATVKVFMDQYCMRCHTAQQRSGNFVLADLDLNRIQDNAKVWEKVVLKLRTGLEPRAEIAPKPASVEMRSVISWLEGELDRNAPVFVPQSQPRRLNRTEYANAIRDLLALEVNATLLLPSEEIVGGFDTILRDERIAGQLRDAYSAAAERIANLAMENSASRQKILVCRPASRDDAACAERIVNNLGARAFRRPLTATETNGLMDVFRQPSGYWHADGAVAGVLRNVLADRRFVYREAEPSGNSAGIYRVSDLELASRLSYFLWSRGPDDQLLDLAARNQLSNPVVLEQQTRRLLKDDRAIALTTNFATQWLWLKNLSTASPMPNYPEFDAALEQAMRQEIQLFFSSIVQEDRSAIDLLDANYTYVNERLAKHYGIPNITGDQFRRLTLSPNFDVRRGLLGKAALLTVTSQPERTSPTTRGRIVLHTLLGVSPPDPPPNVPMMREGSAGSLREALEMHLKNPACASCHRIMDPFGIALENFDQAGKWRTQVKGIAIDPSTELTDGSKINGPADLRNALLSRSDQFVQTLSLKLFTYAMGRKADFQDMPVIRSIARDAARDNNKFSAIVVGIVKSPSFQMSAR